jgi:hypothetical protein
MTSWSRAFPKLAILLVLPLAACQAPNPAGPPPPPRIMPAKSGEVTQPPAAAIPAPPPTVAELAADPQRFKGMSAAEIGGLLGKPSFQRKDAAAEIWQYYGPSSACVLDLFIYPDQATLRVAHAELRSRGTGSSAASVCLKQILDGQRG